VASREWPLICQMQTSRTPKMRIKWSFTGSPKRLAGLTIA
jgi:hypothetical protein